MLAHNFIPSWKKMWRTYELTHLQFEAAVNFFFLQSVYVTLIIINLPSPEERQDDVLCVDDEA